MKHTDDKWALRFLRLADEIRTWSKDPEKQVGSLVISPDGREVSWGYNGFPRNIADDSRLTQSSKNTLMVHAEANALQNCKRDMTGWTLVCTEFPCHECAKLVIQAGISHVLTYAIKNESSWAQSQRVAKELFREADVYVSTWIRLEDVSARED